MGHRESGKGIGNPSSVISEKQSYRHQQLPIILCPVNQLRLQCELLARVRLERERDARTAQ